MMADRDWFPARIHRQRSSLELELRKVPAASFLDPFAEDTLSRVGGAGARRSINLLAPPEFHASSAPAGIIFHVSKSGSTLLSQALKQSRRVTVYSQPGALSDILFPSACWSEMELVTAIRILGSLLAHHACGPYILKLESWNALFCDAILSAFPDTPWIFSFRNPIEVAVSAIEDPDPSLWLKCLSKANNPFIPYLRHPLPIDDPIEAYTALIFDAICTSVMRAEQRLGRFVDYEDLPNAIWTEVAPHFGIELNRSDIARLSQSAKLYSKSPLGTENIFLNDVTSKQARASLALVAAAKRYAYPAFVEVKSLVRRSDSHDRQSYGH